MRKLALAFAATVAIAASGAVATAQAATTGPSPAIRAAIDELNMVQNAQYVYLGREYCWYFDGWHGPGWYWCGYATRRGLGWGGVEGWRNWRREERREMRREHRREERREERRERRY